MAGTPHTRRRSLHSATAAIPASLPTTIPFPSAPAPPAPVPSFFFFNDTATTDIYTLSLHDALPISRGGVRPRLPLPRPEGAPVVRGDRSEEHTSELQSHVNLVCRLLLEKKKKKSTTPLGESDHMVAPVSAHRHGCLSSGDDGGYAAHSPSVAPLGDRRDPCLAPHHDSVPLGPRPPGPRSLLFFF